MVSLLQIGDALKVDEKSSNALSMLGNMELKADDWLKAKETFRIAQDVTGGKDSYATLSLVSNLSFAVKPWGVGILVVNALK